MIVGSVDASLEESRIRLKAALRLSSHSVRVLESSNHAGLVLTPKPRQAFPGHAFFQSRTRVELTASDDDKDCTEIKFRLIPSNADHLAFWGTSIIAIIGLLVVFLVTVMGWSVEIVKSLREWLWVFLFSFPGLRNRLRHDEIERRVWIQLGKHLTPMKIRTRDYRIWDDENHLIVYKDLTILIFLITFPLAAFALVGFPMILALFLFVPHFLNTIAGFLFPVGWYETHKKARLYLSSGWVYWFLFPQIMGFGLLIALWRFAQRTCEVLSRNLSAGEIERVSNSTGPALWWGASWFPFGGDRLIGPADLLLVIRNGRDLHDGGEISSLLWNLAWAILIICFVLALPILLQYLHYWRTSGTQDHNQSQDPSAKTSRRFRLLLVLIFSTHVLLVALGLVVLGVVIMAIFAPSAARMNPLSQPLVDLIDPLSVFIGPPSLLVKCIIVLIAGFPLLLALLPSTYFALAARLQSARTRRLSDYRHPELQGWLLRKGQVMGLRVALDLAVVPARRELPLMFTRFSGVFNKRVLIVLAEELLDDHIMSRDLLKAALIHEIAHAREDSGWVSFLEKLSLISGLGRGFLSLVVDYPAIEDRADDEAARQLGDPHLLIEALKRVEQLETASRFCQSPTAPRTNFVWELLKAIQSMFTPQVMATYYRSVASRSQRLQGGEASEERATQSAAIWYSPLVQWVLALGLLVAPVVASLSLGTAIAPRATWSSELSRSFRTEDAVETLAIFGDDLLVGTPMGLRKLNTVTLEWSTPKWSKSQLLSNVSRILVRNEEVWIASYTQGVAQYKDDEWVAFEAPQYLPSNSVFDLDIAEDGSVWVATTRGLAILSTSNSTNLLSVTEMFKDQPVISLARTWSEVAIATPKKVVVVHKVLGSARTTLYNSDQLGYEHIVGLNSVGDELWVFTAKGIYALSKGIRQVWEMRTLGISDVSWGRSIRSAGGLIAVGAKTDRNGEFRILQEPELKAIVKIPFPESQVRDFLFQNQDIWLATDRGLARITMTNGEWHHESVAYPRVELD